MGVSEAGSPEATAAEATAPGTEPDPAPDPAPGRALVAADLATCPPEQRSLYAYALCSLMRDGYDRVILLRLARPVPVRTAPVLTAARTMALLALTASWPYLTNLAAGALAPGSGLGTTRGHLYGALLSTGCAMMLAMAWAGWRLAERGAADVADMLCASPEREEFRRWLEGTLGFGRQVMCGMAGTVTGIVAAFFDLSRPGGNGTAFGLVYLPAIWTGFLGGMVLYWVIVAARTPHRLRRCRQLRLTWLDPAHTPGVVRLCTCFVLVAAGLGIGVITLELAAVAAAAQDPPLSLRVFLYGFPVGAALLAGYAAVLPFVMLSRVVRAYQADVLGTLMTQVAAPPERLLLDKGLREAAEAYRTLRSLRTLPVRTWAILQYVTGIVASLLIFFIQQALR
ncbi:hypothetical protein [Spirillospora sp. NPDC047279]|uniref:hypothetical protein n=1 Tax=Spirillospora sp. NPDC047279 TaxID=3155478 RepID=UPI0033CA149E